MIRINENLIKDVYSNEETFTGKYWVDGKKIYRKVIQYTTSLGVNQIATIENMDMVINISGIAFRKNDNAIDLNFYYDASNYIKTWVYQNVLFCNPAGYIDYMAYAILEYTKTTD